MERNKIRSGFVGRPQRWFLQRLGAVGGDEGLPEADAAITGRHLGMEVNFERFLAQTFPQQIEKQGVLETAATQTNAVKLGLLADILGKLNERGSEPRMETAADVADRLLMANVAEQPLEHGKSADDPIRVVGNQVKGIDALIRRIVGSHFELD